MDGSVDRWMDGWMVRSIDRSMFVVMPSAYLCLPLLTLPLLTLPLLQFNTDYTDCTVSFYYTKGHSLP